MNQSNNPTIQQETIDIINNRIRDLEQQITERLAVITELRLTVSEMEKLRNDIADAQYGNYVIYLIRRGLVKQS